MGDEEGGGLPAFLAGLPTRRDFTMGIGWVSSSSEGDTLRGYGVCCVLGLGCAGPTGGAADIRGGRVWINGWGGGGDTGRVGRRGCGDTGFGCGLSGRRPSGIVGGALG